MPVNDTKPSLPISRTCYSSCRLGRTESIRSLSIGPSRHSDRLTLDTPFQQFTRQHHLQQPHTLTRVSQHCPAASSSPLSRLQRSKPRKPKEHINLISSPENCGRARRMVSTSDTPNRTKEYGRKPRRKTRLDRYDPKDAGKHPRKSTKDGKKKKPNPKKGHRRLSRAVIGEEFKAPNIKQDRLTVRISHFRPKYLPLTPADTAHFQPWIGALPEW